MGRRAYLGPLAEISASEGRATIKTQREFNEETRYEPSQPGKAGQQDL